MIHSAFGYSRLRTSDLYHPTPQIDQIDDNEHHKATAQTNAIVDMILGPALTIIRP